MAYLSMKDRAQQIREALKAAGIKRSEVGVTVMHYTALKLQLKVEASTLDMQAVFNASEGHESIDRCEATGEILSGGNTFVFVRALTGCLLNRSEFN